MLNMNLLNIFALFDSKMHSDSFVPISAGVGPGGGRIFLVARGEETKFNFGRQFSFSCILFFALFACFTCCLRYFASL